MLLGEKNLEITIDRIKQTLEREDKPSWRDLKNPTGGVYGIVWVGLGLSIFQQFVGINVIFYYSTSLWKSVGFPESASLAISVVTSITNVLVTLIAIFLVDRVGRKPILLIGSVLMTLSLATMAVCFLFSTGSGQDVSLPAPWGPIALIAANLFVVGFGASWGPLVWVLLGEIFPSRIRGKALGVAAGAQWLANFLITVSFPAMSAWSLPLTYGMYAAFAALSFIYVAWKIPETKGMDIEHTETLFTRKNAYKDSSPGTARTGT
jgi:SP family sugar:H+ symporter-like MFS transporter